MRLQQHVADKLSETAVKHGIQVPTAAKILISKALDAGIEP